MKEKKCFSLVSIVIPTFNRKKVIARAIKSVSSQTYKNWELIIVDDGSTDNTKEAIKPFLKDKRIKYFYQENQGVCSARNFGVQKSRGEYISLLDSDDEYRPQRIKTQLELMKEKNALFSLSNRIICINNNERVLKDNLDHFVDKGEIIKGNIGLSASLMLFKKDIFRNVRFDEKLPAGNDLDFILRAMNRYNVLYVNVPLTVIHKTLDYQRISTDPKNKILAHKIILNKIKKSVYKLDERQKKLFLKNTYYTLGVFELMNGGYKTARSFFKKNLEAGFFFSKKYFIALTLYLVSYSPLIINIGFKFAQRLWLKNKIIPRV